MFRTYYRVVLRIIVQPYRNCTLLHVKTADSLQLTAQGYASIQVMQTSEYMSYNNYGLCRALELRDNRYCVIYNQLLTQVVVINTITLQTTHEWVITAVSVNQ